MSPVMKLNKRILILGLAFFLSACSNADKRVETVSENTKPTPQIPADLAYTVRPGDFLSRIAWNTTGDGENWREIALYNDIKDPNKLETGEVILIPGPLLPADSSDQSAKESVAASSEQTSPANAVLKSTTSQPQATAAVENKPEWVMVDGSYYPKAIYREPNYSAAMLTRVLPGTRLKYIKTDKDWIEVETDKGPGYLHRSDARQPDKNEPA